MGSRALNCDELGIPPYLHRKGRPQETHFDKREWLYRRVSPDDYLPDGQISASKWKIPGLSVNRGKYTKSPNKDVLYNITSANHYFSWGIVKIKVGFLEGLEYQHPNLPIIFSFKMLHDPEECMYPHSILSILENNEPTSRNLSPSLKAEFRDHLKNNWTMVKEAD